MCHPYGVLRILWIFHAINISSLTGFLNLCQFLLLISGKPETKEFKYNLPLFIK